MANPLQTMQKAVNSAANTVIGVLKNPFNTKPTNRAGKTDPIFRQVNRDELIRAAFDCNVDVLFQNKDVNPIVVYDNTIKEVINKLSSLVFPIGTRFYLDSDKDNKDLTSLIEQNKFDEKTQLIVEEAAKMGFCGVKTIFDESVKTWITEIIKKEFLELEYYGEQLVSVAIYYKRETARSAYWTKEKWTEFEYFLWPEIEETRKGIRPDFSTKTPEVTPNTYQEIPVTIVSHKKAIGLVGRGVIDEPEIGNQKSIVRLLHNRHWSHNNNMDPPKVRKNHSDPSEPLNISNGDLIDISDGGNDRECDLKLLEYSGVADSVYKEFYDLRCSIYGAAGLKAPPIDENPSVGTINSGVALRVLHKKDLDTVQDLRAKSYIDVIHHLEKMLRIASRLQKIEGINPDNKDTWRVSVSYPEFFDNTDLDKQAALVTLSMADLPPELKAPKVAKIIGLDDEKDIQLLLAHYQKQAQLMEPNANIGG